MLASLGSLMRGANDELLHLTLESLCIIVRQCPETIVTGAQCSPCEDGLWVRKHILWIPVPFYMPYLPCNPSTTIMLALAV